MIRQKPRERREPITTRNGLRIFSTLKNKGTKLKAKTQLKAKKSLKKVSEKQTKINKDWNEVTDIRYEQVGHRCEWCGRIVERIFVDGHHIERRRAGNFILSNCYVVERYGCHQFITDKRVDCHLYPSMVEWNLAHPEKLFKLE